MQQMARFRSLRAALFTVGAVLALATTHSLAAQDAVEESTGDVGCGLYSGPMCEKKQTCVAMPGTDILKCQTEYTYYKMTAE